MANALSVAGCYLRRMVFTVSTVAILGVKLRVMRVYLQLSHTQKTDPTNLDDMKQARLTTKPNGLPRVADSKCNTFYCVGFN